MSIWEIAAPLVAAQGRKEYTANISHNNINLMDEIW